MNHQPRILRSTTPEPESEVPLVVGQPLAIQLFVQDRDVEDVLVVRVFVDYRPDTPQLPPSGVASATPDPLVRLYATELRDLCETAGVSRRVLAAVTDGAFVDGEFDGGREFFPYRTVNGDAETDETSWTVTCEQPIALDGGL